MHVIATVNEKTLLWLLSKGDEVNPVALAEGIS